MSKSSQDLPYRLSAGMMLLDARGRVFLGRRTEGAEHTDRVHVWQMPQGGIDAGEDPWTAARRELYEETNVRSVEKLAEMADWLAYDLPADLIGRAWKGKYRGQRQKWFALRFTGQESEIDIHHPGGGHHPAEFAEWRWEKMDRICDLVVPFKRDIYAQVVAAFQRFAG